VSSSFDSPYTSEMILLLLMSAACNYFFIVLNYRANKVFYYSISCVLKTSSGKQFLNSDNCATPCFIASHCKREVVKSLSFSSSYYFNLSSFCMASLLICSSSLAKSLNFCSFRSDCLCRSVLSFLNFSSLLSIFLNES
jgi:hypothetical protein